MRESSALIGLGSRIRGNDEIELISVSLTLRLHQILVYNFALFHAPVAQMDRVLGYEPRGREFESLRARHKIKWLQVMAV